jgi:hypothetical protein
MAGLSPPASLLALPSLQAAPPISVAPKVNRAARPRRRRGISGGALARCSTESPTPQNGHSSSLTRT